MSAESKINLMEQIPDGVILSKISTVVIPLCFGDPRDPNDGCHDRFCAGVYTLKRKSDPVDDFEVCELDRESTLIIQTGGSDELPLCDLMKRVLETKKPKWAERFMAVRLGCWGTRSEISNALSIIKYLSLVYDGIDTTCPDFKVIVTSHRCHLPRIKYYINRYNLSDWPVEYREAKHPFSFKSRIRERVGLLAIKVWDLILGNDYYHRESSFLQKIRG